MAENFHIEAARANLGTLAKTNLFLFEIPNIPFGDPNDVLFSAESSQVPGVSNEVENVPWMNSEYKLPGTTKYESFSVGFRIAEHMRVYDMLDAWYKLIYNPETGVQSPPEDTLVDARVTLLSLQGDPLRVWKLIGMFPSSISAVSLSREGSDKQVCEVTFEYTYHILEGSGTSGRNLGGLF